MEGIAILVVVAAAGHLAALRLRVPPTPLMMAAGFALARSGLAPVDLLEDALVLGVAFLLFATGIELDPLRVRAQRHAALRVGSVQFVVLGAVGYAAAIGLGYGNFSAAYIALAMTASSTLVVVRLLQRRRQLFEPAARLVTGVLLLQDLLVVLLIPVLTRAPAGVVAVAAGTASGLALVGLAFGVRRIASPLVQKLARSEEVLLLVVLTTLFGFVGLAGLLGLPAVAGAFLAGAALARFPVTGIVRPLLQPIADFFTAIFFTALGALIVLDGPIVIRAIVLAVVVVAVTPPLVAWIAQRHGFATRPALEAGLLLAQTSEISLVVGLYGVLARQIEPGVFSVIALTTLLTMVLTPFLATDRVVWWLLRLFPADRTDPAMRPTGGHVLLLGTGTTGMPLLETILAAGHEVLVVDDDPAVAARLREADVPHIRGDASDENVLREARADRARIISSTIRRPEDNRRLLALAPGVPVLVRVFDEEDAEMVRAMGGTPVLYSRAAADGFLRWYDRESGRLADRVATPGSPASGS